MVNSEDNICCFNEHLPVYIYENQWKKHCVVELVTNIQKSINVSEKGTCSRSKILWLNAITLDVGFIHEHKWKLHRNKKSWYTISYDIFCLYTTHIPNFCIALCILSILISKNFNDLLHTSYILIRIYTILYTERSFFLSWIPTTYHFIWHIPTVYHSLKFFNVFLLMWIVILIKIECYYECICWIYHLHSHYFKM